MTQVQCNIQVTTVLSPQSCHRYPFIDQPVRENEQLGELLALNLGCEFAAFFSVKDTAQGQK